MYRVVSSDLSNLVGSRTLAYYGKAVCNCLAAPVPFYPWSGSFYLVERWVESGFYLVPLRNPGSYPGRFLAVHDTLLIDQTCKLRPKRAPARVFAFSEPDGA